MSAADRVKHDDAEDMLTTEQVAKWWNRSPEYVLRRARQGRLPSRKIGGKRYFEKSDAEEKRPCPVVRATGERAHPITRIPPDWDGWQI